MNHYYTLKPLLPLPLRIALRRFLARRARESCRRVWPVLERAWTAPDGWTGWPDGKRFALVLTHDVEGRRGYGKISHLARLDQEAGIRACFNLVPEGAYRVDPLVREQLMQQGFEVGIHDLRHDSQLYRSPEKFSACADRINRYLKDWGAVGFRSAFMLHNLDWIKQLDILYDSSTFDTDPFEPQSDGVETIFPFLVQRKDGSSYVELPYTLVQDHTLFVLLQEQGIDLWKRKLDWIVEHGGMALLDTHPDYMSFDGRKSRVNEYPVRLYRQFLEYVKTRYEGQYWNATPREVADYYSNGARKPETKGAKSAGTGIYVHSAKSRRIWIDLDNTPHVPFFEPIIEKLKEGGFSLLITARDAFQVCELADLKGIDFIQVGHHYGKKSFAKVYGLVARAMQLMPYVLSFRPDLAISHGARSQIFCCNLLKIPSILIWDYEFAKLVPMARPTWQMVPDSIPDEVIDCSPDKVRRYPGIKENVYAPRFRPDMALPETLGLQAEKIIISVRPPATEAHYFNPNSEKLFYSLMQQLYGNPSVQVILLPRNKNQAREMQRCHPEWFPEKKIIIPPKAEDGMNIIWHSDLVISGGGTMNREAAAMHVPVYSIFRGKIGSVDRHLSEIGKLVLIESEADIDRKILIRKHPRKNDGISENPPTLETIVHHIGEIYRHYHPADSTI